MLSDGLLFDDFLVVGLQKIGGKLAPKILYCFGGREPADVSAIAE